MLWPPGSLHKVFTASKFIGLSSYWLPDYNKEWLEEVQVRRAVHQYTIVLLVCALLYSTDDAPVSHPRGAAALSRGAASGGARSARQA